MVPARWVKPLFLLRKGNTNAAGSQGFFKTVRAGELADAGIAVASGTAVEQYDTIPGIQHQVGVGSLSSSGIGAGVHEHIKAQKATAAARRLKLRIVLIAYRFAPLVGRTFLDILM